MRAIRILLLFALLLSPTPLRAQLCSPGELEFDVRNCGTCGNDCTAAALNANFACQASTCAFRGCRVGFYDLDGDQRCEYACTFVSAQESCNGIDDNCNGQVDENPLLPSVVQTCGVSPLATAPECGAQVQMTCNAGSWQCQFPAGVCTGGNCAATAETCDALDNNCDGRLNENVPNFARACASDDGLPLPGHGLCRTAGTYVCNGPNATVCNAVQADCSSLPGGCTEACDGLDNDCDQLVDEPFSNKGANAAFFVKPAVTRLAANLWMQQYEASRPNASATSAGSGNGYFGSAPAGTTLDRTPACSVPGRLPWSNVTPAEAAQVCSAAGGNLCTQGQFQIACQPNAACTFGYNPRGGAGSACATLYTAVKYCNLAPSYDFNAAVAGDQDGLLPGGSPALLNCWADWSALQGNTAANNRLFDLTGNLREITASGGQFTLMGGSLLQRSEAGASCAFTFYGTDPGFSYYDTGFRCCFGSDPTQ